MERFREIGVESENTPIVIEGNIATAGGCLSAMMYDVISFRLTSKPFKQQATIRPDAEDEE
ncbi:hypothetical protein [Xenorhabdus innexi]|uniref:hypothetical protein n=1 Tax=Xenorhabdus innexi TaxID=290109 RepID=UPI000B35E1D4|nr:hypothetical protein [Xenorhabdus innexi]